MLLTEGHDPWKPFIGRGLSRRTYLPRKVRGFRGVWGTWGIFLGMKWGHSEVEEGIEAPTRKFTRRALRAE